MIDRIKRFFHDRIETPEGPPDDAIRLATAALLVEVMAIDHHPDAREQQKIHQLLERTFSLSAREVSELFALAETERHEATSLYQFTRLVNRHFGEEQKFQLVLNLWHVAYADGRLDKYEEGIIRRISELIYLPHSHFIRARQIARKRVTPPPGHESDP